MIPEFDWRDIGKNVRRSVSAGLTRFPVCGPSRVDVVEMLGHALIVFEQDDDAVPPFMIVLDDAGLDEGQAFVDRLIDGRPEEVLSEPEVEARVLSMWRADLPLGMIARGYPISRKPPGFIVTVSHPALSDRSRRPVIGKPFLLFTNGENAAHWAEDLGAHLDAVLERPERLQ